MAKSWLRLPASEVQVGDLVNMSSSMYPTDRFHRVTEVRRTTPTVPVPGAMPCTHLIVCGKRRSFHVPESSVITVKR